jgi:N-acetylmuramoyl-L-alanine amidase
MATYLVQQGDCMSSIAARYGMKSYRDLYDLPENAELKKKRPNPNVLFPGDVVAVPDPPRRWEVRRTEKRHKFVVPSEPVKLRDVVRSYGGEPRAGKRFLVKVGESEVTGTTTAAGLVDAEIPATASTARLRGWLGEAAEPEIDRELHIGHLDPIETISGVQARLSNLGYACDITGELAPDLDEPTLVAARAFRAKSGLKEIARPDGASSAPPADADDAAARDYAAQLLDDDFRGKLAAAYQASGASS